MGNIEHPGHDRREEARRELRSRYVGVLLQIIEELEEMKLSQDQIETILVTCGLNTDCAVSFGEKMKTWKTASTTKLIIAGIFCLMNYVSIPLG